MKMWEALKALEEGKCVAKVGFRFPEAYLKMEGDKMFWCNYGGMKSFEHRSIDSDDLAADWKVVDEAEHKKLAPAGTHRCGRRDESYHGMQEPDALPDHYRNLGDGERCSYCGSVSGDSFMAFVRAGGEVGPTDKNYKAYLHDVVDPSSMQATVKAPGMKFYFQHLSEEQKMEFIDLLNAGKVRVGMPGHFYVLPYFCRRLSKEEGQ